MGLVFALEAVLRKLVRSSIELARELDSEEVSRDSGSKTDLGLRLTSGDLLSTRRLEVALGDLSRLTAAIVRNQSPGSQASLTNCMQSYPPSSRISDQRALTAIHLPVSNCAITTLSAHFPVRSSAVPIGLRWWRLKMAMIRDPEQGWKGGRARMRGKLGGWMGAMNRRVPRAPASLQPRYSLASHRKRARLACHHNSVCLLLSCW